MERQPRFAELRNALDDQGRAALETLLSVPFDEDHAIYGPLYRARNKAGFHFDPRDFAAAIRTMLERFGGDVRSSFIGEPKPGARHRVRTYYTFADQIALQISFGLPRPKERQPDAHEALVAAIDLHAALSVFLESAVVAYCRLRDIPPVAFKIREADTP
jgi:hypothetical protein